ncbi:MAG: hypothetical protein B6241_13130 [Spirochaetaceae bacterium 4572_59]|nr:MAG: hypothetical protein B6241_13130 [Spirochaetaceae bacterium 4572_59]
MNEKRFLYLILTLIFLVLSALSTLLIMVEMQRTLMNFLLENEKLMNQAYQMYQKDALDSSKFRQEISSLGFYNFYRESLYQSGNAPSRLSFKKVKKPFFNRERNSIVVVRDLLNPFQPLFSNDEVIKAAHEAMYDNARKKPEEVKRTMVRFIYLEITDTPIQGFIFRRWILMGIVVLLILVIVLYIGSLYRRNMKYHNQIESQERLVLLGTAARTLTHEVKNPLSSIRLQSAIIARSGCGLHDQSLKVINDEVIRLATMTERVGDFLRHPEGNPCRCDMKEEVLRVLNRRSENFNLEIPENLSDMPLLIDPERLHSILENLLNNAVESGSDLQDISISLERYALRGVLVVSDKGEGIPEDQLKRIYDPFFTTKSKGSGVGLSIIQTFTHAAEGSINIDSSPDNGSTVKISFPLIKE